MSETKEVEYREIDLSIIDPPPEPDRISISPGEIKELADSIIQVGLLQPILLSENNGRFEIVFGHRRFLACQSIGRARIFAKIGNYSPEEVATLRATENLQRENLTPIEEAKIYFRLTERLGMSLEQAGKIMGKGPGVVKRRIDLLKMPDKFQKALHEKKINIAVAEELWRCPDATYQDYLLDMAVEHGITTPVARLWVDDYKKGIRTREMGAMDGGRGLAVFETTKNYVACDACKGPVEMEKIKPIRICPQCLKAIIENLSVNQ